MVDINYIQQGQESNQDTVYPNNQQVQSYNETSGDPVQLLFYDTLFIILCMCSVIPTISRCLYVQYIKNNRQNRVQVNPIDNLQTLIITNNVPDDVCTICLEEFKFDEELKKLKCGHMYHKECLKPWLENKKRCPICRANIV